jgi:hypothetical protein
MFPDDEHRTYIFLKAPNLCMDVSYCQICAAPAPVPLPHNHPSYPIPHPQPFPSSTRLLPHLKGDDFSHVLASLMGWLRGMREARDGEKLGGPAA